MTTWTTQVIEDPDTGDTVIVIPEEVLENLGYQTGDTLDYQIVDNQIHISKKKQMTTIKFSEYRRKKAAIDQLEQLASMTIFQCDFKLANRLREVAAEVQAEIDSYEFIEITAADWETFIVNQNTSIGQYEGWT